MGKSIAFILCVLCSGIALANSLRFEKECGEYKYIITIEYLKTHYDLLIKHYYQKGQGAEKLFHQSEEGTVVTASCTKGRNNSEMFVFSEVCDGNACIEDIYGLFDPQQKKMLLNPSDWPKGNLAELISILGFEPDVSNFDVPKFCCRAQLVDAEEKRQLNKIQTSKGKSHS